jgi:Arc/MetJ family transcription regulator
MMKTTINLDDDLLSECRKLSGGKTDDDIVCSALKEYVRMLKRRKMLELEGKVKWSRDIEK